VPKLARFSLPAGLPDDHPGAWNRRVKQILSAAPQGNDLPQFYDPTERNTPASAARPMVMWTAFPAALRVTLPSAEQRWRHADRRRGVQDEYCEWAVTRNDDGKITRVTFTTEVPEYFEHLHDTAPRKLLQLYRRLVGPEVELAHLRKRDGTYQRRNRWNRGGHLAHLTSGPNTLFAAAELVAQATIRRVDGDGMTVVNQQALVKCGALGDHRRNSDPQIAAAVNAAAREGDEIALSDPPGLYLGRPLTAGMETPDGADAARFWRIERGDAEHTLRARFEVPKQRGYVVGDIEIDGKPIRFGGQLAERVPVWITVIVKEADHTPKTEPCVAGSGLTG
jgi:hypothetical protein